MTEQGIIQKLYQNASVFLNDAIRHFNEGISSHSNMVLTVVALQMSVELAMKVRISLDYGVAMILENTAANTTADAIIQGYERNSLRVKEFDQLKNFLKREYREAFSGEYAYMERFQKYRNKLVHFDYSFSEDEHKELENDIVHIIVYIVHSLLSSSVSDDEYRKYVFEAIDSNEYQKLLENPDFDAELNNLIVREYGDYHTCPICNRKFLTPHMKCLGCLINLDDGVAFGFVRCGYCTRRTVLYDKLNIPINRTMRGRCVHCGDDTIVYLCPICGTVTNLEDFMTNGCKPGYCVEFDLGT